MNERFLKREWKNNCDKRIYGKSSWYKSFTTSELQHSVQYRRVTLQRSKICAYLVFLMPDANTGPEAHTPSYSKGTVRVTSLEEERPGREVNRSLPSNAEGKIEWSHVSIPPPLFFPLWRCDPTRVMASSFLRFLDHTQRRTIVDRTPLDKWSARRRDLYLTTHNTHNRRQTSRPPVGFEPKISAGERPQTYALDRAATGTGLYSPLHVFMS